ncbi:opacity protein [Pacificimonas sp. WHA3]|uniref:Opacity protein n=1 Tax=Pacificimonas pallii TaxID=2827236 RepID=A0ABS6SD71_9SPHN|nr:porin family protein [Pacificimonas pallii]MBV7256053.1 opacity protein [Pacificimonas pallii]
MFRSFTLAAIAAITLPFAAQAQDAPDGSKAFGIEPYVGIGAGYHDFDRRGASPLNNAPDSTDGSLIIGTAGVNVPLGAFFVGAEANLAYGFDEIDWEYGAAGRFGVRIGESGLLFGKVGYQWIEEERGFKDDKGMLYGMGVEVGPQDIGLGGVTGESGVRLRLGVDTFGDFESIRPNASAIFHF